MPVQGSQQKTAWLKAIKAGNFATWPHLTAKAVKKHFQESDETAHGTGQHENVKEGIRSTIEEGPRQYIKQQEDEKSELTGPVGKESSGNNVYRPNWCFFL